MKALDWKGISLCVVIATLIWFFNALNKTYTTRIRFPVIFKTKQNNVVPVNDPPNSLEVEVTGQGWSLFRKNFGIGVEPVIIDLINVLRVKNFPTKAFLPIFSIQFKDIKINQIIPDTIKLDYNNVISKEIYLDLPISQVDLKEDYRITSPIQIAPNRVTFTGASSLVEALGDTIFLSIKAEDGISKNYNDYVAIQYPVHKHLKPKVEKVRVSFQVSLFVQHNQLIPIELLNFPADSSATIDERSVILEYWLRKEKENRVRTDTIKAIVDFRARNKKDSTITPMLWIPQDLTNTKVTPSKVKIHYGKYTKNRNNRRDRSR
ncbi:YbbR-like domain-containing protein [Thermoflexibacter ruber]|uniref:YbbR-like protein n=1 Tax=Thermoflexibacter ruber TaxID=1003 RepID=A0A1I2EGV9_9BACT|nr:hypothetical protein [Thermoflexibacter ruber]SFE91877.1 hypothetical protein SAMN04488541_10106 [Thermoflexibacter ruber]